ncbi:MAG: ribonuclease P [bacterium]
MARRRNKGEERDVAGGRIAKLLELARDEALAGRLERSDRYGSLCLRIAEKYQTGLDARAKAQLCRKCGAFRVAGKTSRTRITSGRVATTCLRCGNVSRRLLHGRTPSSTGKASATP